MTETTGPAKRRRAGRAKPIDFRYLGADRQKEYYEVSNFGVPAEDEVLLGPLTGYFDTGGYAFSRYPSIINVPNWRDFVDPDRYQYRAYNRHLAEQAAILTHAIETTLTSGYADGLDPGWHEPLQYLSAMRFHEGGVLKLWQMAQYMTPAESISFCCVEECGSRLLSQHALNRYALDLTEAVPAWDDKNAQELWVDDPCFGGVREYVEQELTVRDWVEVLVADGIVATDLYYVPLLRFFGITAANHGDPSTPTIMSVLTAFAERRARWATAVLELCLTVDANREPLAAWLQTWEARAQAALERLAPLYHKTPHQVLEHGAEMARARRNYEARLQEAGLELTRRVA